MKTMKQDISTNEDARKIDDGIRKDIRCHEWIGDVIAITLIVLGCAAVAVVIFSAC